MPYWFGQVGHSLDDIFEEADGRVQVADNYEPFKDDCLRLSRFTGVNVPRNATILDARLVPRLSSGSQDKADFRIYGEATGNSARPSALAPDNAISSKSLTTNYAEFVDTDFSDGAAGRFHWQITDVVQELVNRGDWTGGNAMSFVIRDNGTSLTLFKNYDIGDPDYLYILYEIPGASICRSVVHGLDDGRQAGSTFSHDGIGIYLGGMPQYGLIRFTNITIPAGAEITSCKLQLYVPSSGDPALTISVEDIANSARLASLSATIDDKDFGTVEVDWSATGLTDWQDTPELKTLLQHVVDQGGWASGNAASFIFYNQTDGEIFYPSAYEHSWERQDEHWQAAKLHVWYTAVAGRYKIQQLATGLTGGLRQGAS
jgi:type IV pilus assembly protein PilY1